MSVYLSPPSLFLSVPSAPPRKVDVEVLNSTAIQVFWRSPVQNRQHGQIRGYQVHYVCMENGEAKGLPQIKDVMLADAQVNIYPLFSFVHFFSSMSRFSSSPPYRPYRLSMSTSDKTQFQKGTWMQSYSLIPGPFFSQCGLITLVPCAYVLIISLQLSDSFVSDLVGFITNVHKWSYAWVTDKGESCKLKCCEIAQAHISNLVLEF